MGRLMIACMMWMTVGVAGQPVLGQAADETPVIIETTPASEPQVEDDDGGGRILRYALIGAVVGGVVGGVMALFSKKKTKT